MKGFRGKAIWVAAVVAPALMGSAAVAAEAPGAGPKLVMGKYGAYVVAKAETAPRPAKVAATAVKSAPVAAAATESATTAAPAPAPAAALAVAAPTPIPAQPEWQPIKAVAREAASDAARREEERDARLDKQISQLVMATSLANAAASEARRASDGLLLPIWIAAIGSLLTALLSLRSLFESRKSLRSIKARLHGLATRGA